jgi:signal transduction histidine kinase
MKFARHISAAFVILSAQGFAGFLTAQSTPGNAPAPPVTNNAPIRIPPGPFITPPNKSPVDLFRQLLAVTPLERIKIISGKPPATQRLILAKVREYQSLKPEERELRLRVTELRWYVWPLMNMSPMNRAGRLALVPQDFQQPIAERLQHWDSLPPDLQKELLDNEAAIRYFTEAAVQTPGQQEQMLANMSAARRELLEKGRRQWQALPEPQRAKIADRFNRFFELTREEREKELHTLSEPERQQIERTLDKFESLSPVRRAICIRSFEKFASLNVEERQLFLKNAERWKLMTPSERQAWKDLVAKLSARHGLMPSFTPLRLSSVLATNR